LRRRQQAAEAVDIGRRINFRLRAFLGLSVMLPNDDGEKTQQHRVQDPDDRDHETGDLVMFDEDVR
jgi:hypothetical protein